jgi:hypothetical protein
MTSSLLGAGPQLSLVCHLKVIRLLLRDMASEAYEIIDEAEQHESWGGGSARYTRSHGSLLNYNNVVTSSAGKDRIKKDDQKSFLQDERSLSCSRVFVLHPSEHNSAVRASMVIGE